METIIETELAPALPPPDARVELGRAMLGAALPPAVMECLCGNGPYGLIVVSPSPEHVDIIADAFQDIPGEPEVRCLQKPTAQGAADLVERLAGGEIVVAICSDTGQVPASFKALADATLFVPTHDARMLRAVVAAVLEGPIPRLGKRFTVHPDPELLCRCIVPGLSMGKVVGALTKLGDLCKPTLPDRLPDLDGAIEFGEAQMWGLRVKGELEAWRAGKMAAEDLDGSVLLVSPPGYGKTVFARVLAEGLGVKLMEIKLGDLLVGEGHLGTVIAELRQRFSAAVAAAPVVLLLDELDSLGRRDEPERSKSFKTGLINEMLTLLDGAGQRRPGLVIIGATNAPNAVDPALRRPGRLGRTIELELPGPEGIANILRFHLRDDLVKATLDDIVRLNRGRTPAELMDLVRRARQDARAEGRHLKVSDLMLQTVGTEPVDWTMVNRVAIHEAGHALACLLLPEAPMLYSVSILEKPDIMGRALTAKLPGAMTRSRLEARVMMVLAGRAAESLIFGDADPSDGATGDLRDATSLLCHLHASWGMGDTLVHVPDPEELLVTDRAFAERIERELARLLEAVTEELRGREAYLLEIAFGLCTRRILSGQEVMHIVGTVNGLVDQMDQERGPGVTA